MAGSALQKEEMSSSSRTESKRKADDQDDTVEKRVKGNLTIDQEWERFQKEVLQSASMQKEEQGNEMAYAGATIEVAAVLGEGNEVQERAENGENELEDEDDEEDAEKKDLLQRIEDEREAQEEAMQRVKSLRQRLEKIRQAKEQAKAKEKPAGGGEPL